MFVLMYRRGGRGKWRSVGEYPTFTAAFTAIGGRGDWWISERATAVAAAAGLFDAVPSAGPPGPDLAPFRLPAHPEPIAPGRAVLCDPRPVGVATIVGMERDRQDVATG